MKKKKVLSILLAAVMATAMMAGCGGKEEDTSKGEKKETENLRETIKLLKEQIESLNSQILRLDSNLKDKDIIIELLKERRKDM